MKKKFGEKLKTPFNLNDPEKYSKQKTKIYKFD